MEFTGWCSICLDIKAKGTKKATLCSGPDLFEQVIQATAHLPINNYLCCGAEGTAAALAEKCSEWGNKNIVGHNSAQFKDFTEEDYKAIAKQINTAETTMLYAGLGPPKQIYFSYEISKFTKAQFIIPIGAAFDFHTDKVKKAPKWIQKCGIEWFYRLCQEPKRPDKRYLTVVPFFIWYNFIGIFQKN